MTNSSDGKGCLTASKLIKESEKHIYLKSYLGFRGFLFYGCNKKLFRFRHFVMIACIFCMPYAKVQFLSSTIHTYITVLFTNLV
jgi:hypothetical protein